MLRRRSEKEVDKVVREKVQGFPGSVASSVFDDPGFQKKMNSWMIGTHIQWGITLAVSFIGLNYTIIWLDPAPWVVSVVFTPIGVGYLGWQWWKYRKKNVPRGTSEEPSPQGVA